MKAKEAITLVMVCDNHLAVMLSVLLKSLENTYKGQDDVNIYIVNDGLIKRNVDRINRTISSDRFKIHWKTMKEAVPSQIELPKDRSTLPICAYIRICAPYFLPREIKKAIYLDVDMVIMRDISDLWNIDIGEHVIGAAIDRADLVSTPWGGIPNYKALGIPAESKYFNSGLLMMNLEKWREIGATQQVIDVIRENYEFVTFSDQYGLNVVFANKWFQLDPSWNRYPQESHKDPFLIHFTGMKPIFKSYNFNQEYRDIFYSILKTTPWSDFRPKSNYLRLAKKAYNVMVKKASVFSWS